jgi:DNA-binding MarR family transcriptional regulator
LQNAQAGRKRAAPNDKQEGSAGLSGFSLQNRPGFLIRRLHQIHLAIFAEECARFQVTPVQYSVLSALQEHGRSDQISLARETGIDRTNVAEVLHRLEARGLVIRAPGEQDRRTNYASLSRKGKALVESMAAAAKQAHDRTIAPLAPEQRAPFLAALRDLVSANNELGRAPLRYAWAREHQR